MGPLYFAPLEGITDESYRLVIQKLYPSWDRLFTDFLRIPSIGHYNIKKVKDHFGQSAYKSKELISKTTYQILVSQRSNLKETLDNIIELGFNHLDLNLGCPSDTVNKNLGGAYLLSEPQALKKIVKEIRSHFKGHFSVKMRIGYLDDTTFIENLNMFEDEGVEMITLHARTKSQLYKGRADWNYIKRAVETTKLPVIGNGDLWNPKDILDMFNQTGCYGVMLGRGAMKTPWMPELLKENKDWDQEELNQYRKNQIPDYFYYLEKEYQKHSDDMGILKRFKALSRYLFDDFENGNELKSKFLRTKTLSEFHSQLEIF